MEVNLILMLMLSFFFFLQGFPCGGEVHWWAKVQGFPSASQGTEKCCWHQQDVFTFIKKKRKRKEKQYSIMEADWEGKMGPDCGH